MLRSKRILLDFLYPIIILLSLSLLFWFSGLDIFLESLFYNKESGWFLKQSYIFSFIYDYGAIIPILIFLTGFIAMILSFFYKKFKTYRKVFCLIVLLMFIGSGVISNYIFKDHWGRPRPREIHEFGGRYQFVHHWAIGNSGKNSSFPSGHASAAFFMIFPYFVFKNRDKNKAWIFLFLGLVYGLIMGLARMVQGGHFASDVIWAGGFMYLTGLSIYYLLKMDKKLYYKDDNI